MSEKTDQVVKLRRKYDANPAGFGDARRWLDAENALTVPEFDEYLVEYQALARLDQARRAMEDAKVENAAAWQRFQDAMSEEWAASNAYDESRKKVSKTRAKLTALEQERTRLF